MMKKMISRMKRYKETVLWWIKGDKDITPYDEWYYIYITFKELIEVIKTKNK
jgi:hypothetical protein